MSSFPYTRPKSTGAVVTQDQIDKIFSLKPLGFKIDETRSSDNHVIFVNGNEEWHFEANGSITHKTVNHDNTQSSNNVPGNES